MFLHYQLRVEDLVNPVCRTIRASIATLNAVVPSAGVSSTITNVLTTVVSVQALNVYCATCIE